MKKIILLISFIFCFSYASGEVFYCSEEINVGFRIKTNEKMQFHEKKFKIKIDFKKPMVQSIDLRLGSYDGVHCRTSQNTMYCHSNLGFAFSFNRGSYKFIYAKTFLMNDTPDTNSISWGTCENF